ncbi:ubiquinone biosynthesis protein UbiH [Arsukibacterium ikkense]|uniref:Ubiquinone biosynthesis protein UbiH n=1 Tax=Arsukibacterium ikkense TaxID=336831 RepID=A0A0M2V4W2_9GAMM|nr:FAD-dependent oxidoreductase [Arsukibacterium ikkense]KKO45671.1 ubiquinone biosynthesis protein UbiH [Arsukibacterium ikkense]
MQNTDITIVGGGSAGLTLALLLARQQLRVVLVEQGPAPSAAAPAYNRVSALNMASRSLFQQLGIWPQLLAGAAAYTTMQVWEADSFAKIGFSAEQQQLEALGYICDNEHIRQLLYSQLQQYSNVQCYFNVAISQLKQGEREVMLQLDNNELVLSQLLVGADGVNSFVRQHMQLPLTHWDYQHTAIVAKIRCTEPHQLSARQVFLPSGPLALLPLPEPDVCSIVWSAETAEAKRLMALDNTAFEQALCAASQAVLGPVKLQSERQAFGLTMRYASSWQRGRVVLVADAAHSIHPLAGQGMNLGLMDVTALAQLIGEQQALAEDIAATAMLRRYERWRKAEAQSMIVAMEAFKRGFSAKPALAKLLRGLGLAAVDQLPLIKQQLMAYALGLKGDLPELVKNQGAVVDSLP